MCIPFALFSAIGKIAWAEGVIDQTGGEELASVPKGREVTNEVSKVSVDLESYSEGVNEGSSKVRGDSAPLPSLRYLGLAD